MWQLETRNQATAFLVVASSLAIMAAFGNGAGGLTRVLLGTVMVLLSPGYALLLAICPRKGQLTIMERVVLSFGLSMAIVPLLLYPLNFTPWGIEPCSAFLTVLGFIITMFLAAFYRQSKMPAKERAALSIAFPKPRWDKMPSLDRVIVVFSIIVAIFTLALLAGFYGTSKEGSVTEFYVLGPGGEIESYPEAVVEGESMDLIVGVGNYEKETLVYSIFINIDGKNAMIVKPLQIGPGQNWEQRFQVPILTGRGKRMVELSLMREGMKQAYRNLYFWVDVK